MGYVYGHYRSSNDQIFYVGISKRSNNYYRAYTKHSRNKIWNNIADKGYYVKILHENVSEDFAKEMEVRLIKKHGRIDNGTGILANMTDGGDGLIGFVATPEYRAKISKQWKGVKRSIETRVKMSKPKSNDHTENARVARAKILLNTQNGVFYFGHKEAADSLGMKRRTLHAMTSGVNRNKTNIIVTSCH